MLYRVRYALLVRLGTAEFFAKEYSNKHHKVSEIPSAFHAAISRIDLKGLQTFGKAKRIAFDLAYGHRTGKGLSSDSGHALKLIYAGDAGVCSDYAQVYTGLCVASGVKIREWGLCDDFVQMKCGHSFCEVFSSEYNKWVFIDAYRSIFATRRGQNEPIGVIELIDLVTAKLADRIQFRYIVEERRQQDGPRLTDIYCSSRNIFFLLSDYDVFKQDKIIKWANVLPLPLLHFMLLITGEYPRFHVYINHNNERVIKEKLMALRRYFLHTLGGTNLKV